MPNEIKKDLLLILKKIKDISYANANIFSKLDSIEMLDLILAMEKKFKIKINYLFLNKKNFKNINFLANLIDKIKNEKI